jgi:hypothetical protein
MLNLLAKNALVCTEIHVEMHGRFNMLSFNVVKVVGLYEQCGIFSCILLCAC